MKFKIVFGLLFICAVSFAQRGVWTAFKNEKFNIGYKDSHGNVIFPPVLSSWPTPAIRLKNIACVTEADSGTTYYLLRDGRTIGRDSVYNDESKMDDSKFDCESEGYIRFSDFKNRTVGMFNSQGKEGIPPHYTELRPFINGLAVGILAPKNTPALKPQEQSGHNEGRWHGGGRSVLINTKNEILVENFNFDTGTDFHSLKITKTIPDNPLLDVYLGTNSKYYSFINNKKLFKSFLIKIIESKSVRLLIKNTKPIVRFKGQRQREEFIKANYKKLISLFSAVYDPDTYNSISIDNYLPEIHDDPKYKKYYNNCGDLDISRCPVIRFDLFSSFFTFIKSGDGFVLMEVVSIDEDLK